MYNSELKQRFISEKTNSIKTAASYKFLFDSIEHFEIDAGVDVCQMNPEMMSVVVNSLSSAKRTTYFTSMYNRLKQYVDWCVKSGVDGANNIPKMSSCGISDDFAKEIIRSPKHLDSVFSRIFNPDELESIDVIYKTYLWLAYSGIYDGSKTVFINDDDVDFSYMVVRYDGREYEIYREAIKTFKFCCNIKIFRFIRGQNGGSSQVKRVDGKCLLRATAGSDSDADRASAYMRVRTSLPRRTRNNRESGVDIPDLSYKNVWLSGVFYRNYERELAGLDVDFSQAASDEVGIDICGQERIYRMNRCIVLLKRDYERWKMALDIK